MFKTCQSESKVLTLTSNAPGDSSSPLISLFLHFLSLSPMFTPLPPSLFPCCYLNMLRPLQLGIDFVFSPFSTCNTPLSDICQAHPLNAVRSLLKYYPLEGAFTCIKGQCPHRHSPPLYPALYFLCSSYHHLMYCRFICSFVHCLPLPLECRF